MLQEIRNAVDFITNVLLKRQSVSENICEKFNSTLIDAFKQRFREHWFPESPDRGSAYRCVRINYDMDPILSKVCAKIGLDINLLKSSLPYEITVWIDPEEVSYRIGEDGSIGVLYASKQEVTQRSCKREASPVQRLQMVQPVYAS